MKYHYYMKNKILKYTATKMYAEKSRSAPPPSVYN